MEAEWAKKKIEKVQRCQQKKITLVQVTFCTNVGAPSTTIASSLSSVVSDNGLSFALVDSPSAGVGTPSIASTSPLFFTGGIDPGSAVSGNGFLSPIAGGISSVYAVSGSSLLSSIAGGVGSVSAISSNGLLSLVTDSIGFASSVSGGGPFFHIVDDSLSSPIASGTSSAADSSALSLSGTPSRMHCPSLASLTILLASFVTPITGKRLFDEAFNKQRHFALTYQQKELDLSFEECLYSLSVKINRLCQSKLYDPKPVCLLEAILLLSLLFWDNSFIFCSKHTSLLAKKLGLATSWQVNNMDIKEHMEVIWYNKIINGLDTLFAYHFEW